MSTTSTLDMTQKNPTTRYISRAFQMSTTTELVLRTLDITLKNPTARFISPDAYVGKLGPTMPIVVALMPGTETPELLAEVTAAAKAAGFEPRAASFAPPDADGRWPDVLAADDEPTAWPAVAIEPVTETEAETTMPNCPVTETKAESLFPSMRYVSPYALAAVTAAKAELETAARGVAQAILERLADSSNNTVWKECPGLQVTWNTADDGGGMYFRPIYVLFHKQGKFGIALATAVCEWARRFSGLLVKTAEEKHAIRPASSTIDEKAFPPGKDNCNWMNVIITVQEFPTRGAHCDDKPYLFDYRTDIVELDFARAAFMAMCAVSKEASAE